jgi:hypothetical protein
MTKARSIERLNKLIDATFEPEPIHKRHGLGEFGRELKRRIAAGEDANLLARLLLKWVIEAGEAPIEWNRHLVEIPDTFAVARWSRDADVAQIARCILATLKYEPHAADTSTLREVLMAIAGKGSCT